MTTTEKHYVESGNRKNYKGEEILLRMLVGLSTKLIEFDSEYKIITIQVEVLKKYKGSVNKAVAEAADYWNKILRNSNLAACKALVINSKEYSYKRELFHLGVRPGHDCIKGLIFKNQI